MLSTNGFSNPRKGVRDEAVSTEGYTTSTLVEHLPHIFRLNQLRLERLPQVHLRQQTFGVQPGGNGLRVADGNAPHGFVTKFGEGVDARCRVRRHDEHERVACEIFPRVNRDQVLPREHVHLVLPRAGKHVSRWRRRAVTVQYGSQESSLPFDY